MKLNSFILFILIAFNAISQIEVRLNNGNELNITTACFSNDENSIITGGWKGDIKVWNTNHFKVLSSFQLENEIVKGIAATPKDNIFICHQLFSISLIDIQNNEKVAINTKFKISDLKLTQNLIFIASDQNLYSYNSIKDLNNVKYPTFIFPEKINKITPINDSLIWAISNINIYRLNLSSKEIIKVTYDKNDKLKSINNDENHIIVSGANFTYIASVLSNKITQYFPSIHNSAVIANNELVGIEYNKSKIRNTNLTDTIIFPIEYEEPSFKYISNVFKSPKNNYILGVNYTNLALWDIDTKLLIGEYKKNNNKINSISSNHKDKLIFGYGIDGTSIVLDLKKMSIFPLYLNSWNVQSTATLLNQSWIFGHDYIANKVDLEHQNFKKRFNIVNPKDSVKKFVKPTGIQMLFDTISEAKVYKSLFIDNKIILSFDTQIKIYSETKNKYQLLRGHKDLIKDISISPNQKYISSVSLDKHVGVWELKKGKLKSFFNGNSSLLYAVQFIDDNVVITGGLNGMIKTWDIKGNELFTNKISDDIISNIVVNKNKDIVVSSNNKIHFISNKLDILKSFQSEHIVKELHFFNDTLLISLNQNNLIEIWDINKGKIMSIVITNDGIIFVTPDGYYFGGKNTIQNNLFYLYNNKFYPFEQFDLIYNRPDIILKRLGIVDKDEIKLYKNAYLKRVQLIEDKTEIEKILLLPEPKLILNNYKPITDLDSITCKVLVEDTGLSVNKIHCWVNDVAIYGMNGLKINSSKEINQIINIPLMTGGNKIQICYETEKGLISLKKEFWVRKTNKKFKQDLYLIAIGVSEFKNSNYNLKYAAKDADDIVKTITNNDLYDNFYIKQLTNEKVTLKNIEQLTQFLKFAKPDDVVIIFIANHGVLDYEYNYYLASHDMDFSNPKVNGINYNQIESLLDGIAPLRKIVLLDACHSGEIDKEVIKESIAQDIVDGEIIFRNTGNSIIVNNNNYKISELSKSIFSDIRKGNGSSVISSSSGYNFSIESDQWKNGLFTYCFLKGIESNEADLNQDGQIWLKEMQKYIYIKVSKLSDNQQKPTSRIMNKFLDIRIK